MQGPNPTFVGHIESLDEDWAAITDHFEVDHSFIGRRRGNSNSTLTETPASASPSLSPLSATKDDHYRLVEGLAELYTHKPEYLRALCVLYFFDFYCFDYEFPAECAEVKQNMTTYLVRNGLF